MLFKVFHGEAWTGQTKRGEEGLCLKPTCRVGINKAGIRKSFCGQAQNRAPTGERGNRSGT